MNRAERRALARKGNAERVKAAKLLEQSCNYPTCAGCIFYDPDDDSVSCWLRDVEPRFWGIEELADAWEVRI